jgi:hypothetical protein
LKKCRTRELFTNSEEDGRGFLLYGYREKERESRENKVNWEGTGGGGSGF